MNAKPRDLAVLDWDGTLRPGILLLDWAQFLANSDYIGTRALASMLDMAAEYRTGRLPYDAFVAGVVTAYGASLRGVSVEAIRAAAHDFVAEDERRLFPVSRPLVAFLKERGLETVLISGSPIEPLSEYATVLGVARVFATELRTADGRYTGEVLRNMAERTEKEAAVRSVSKQTIAFGIGDRPADAPLVNIARLGAFAAADGAEPPASFRSDVVRLSVTATRDQVEIALAGLSSRKVP